VYNPYQPINFFAPPKSPAPGQRTDGTAKAKATARLQAAFLVMVFAASAHRSRSLPQALAAAATNPQGKNTRQKKTARSCIKHNVFL
jgi:hypothetical protein